MSSQNIDNTERKSSSNNSLAAGVILIVIGAGLLLFKFINLPMLFPLVLGSVFLAAGIATRKAGLMIPGGIISGVGLGTLSTVNAWFYPINSLASGGVFMLFFSLGWFAIVLFSKLFTNETQTWALVPGTIIAGIGGLILLGETGLKILEMFGTYWPLILVIIGASILLGWWKERK